MPLPNAVTPTILSNGFETEGVTISADKAILIDKIETVTGIDLDTIDGSIKMDNIITQDMEKIDIDRQIMMNIDIITDILYEEFLVK